MPNHNSVTLIGHLTADAEIKYTPKGTAIANFSIAVSRRHVVGDEKREETSFFECEMYAKRAEAFAEYVKKGHPVFLAGRLKQDTWQDKESGQKRSKVKVVVEDFEFLKGRENGASKAEASDAPRPPSQAPKPPADPDLDAQPDDIPF